MRRRTDLEKYTGKIHTWKEPDTRIPRGTVQHNRRREIIRFAGVTSGSLARHRSSYTPFIYIFSEGGVGSCAPSIRREIQKPGRQPPQQLCRGLKRYQGDFRGVWLPTGIRGMRLTLEFHRSSRAGGWSARSFPSRSQLIETGQVKLGPNLTYVRRSARNEHAKETAIVPSLTFDSIDWIDVLIQLKRVCYTDTAPLRWKKGDFLRRFRRCGTRSLRRITLIQ